MIAYFLTALFVATAVFALGMRRSPYHHVGPVWIGLTVSVFIGAAWPLLSLWAIGYYISVGVRVLWRWALGHHNRVRIVAIKPAPSRSMADAMRGYDAQGRIR